MKTPKAKAKPCHCDGYWFPHRVGGGKCKYERHGVFKGGGIVQLPNPVGDYPF